MSFSLVNIANKIIIFRRMLPAKIQYDIIKYLDFNVEE